MIFLVLIMLVDIITRRAAESAPVMEVSEVQRLEAEVAALEEKAKRLLAELRVQREATAAAAESRRRAESELADAEARIRRTEKERSKADKAATDAAAAKAQAAERQRSAESELGDVETSARKAEEEGRMAGDATLDAIAVNVPISEKVRILEARASELEKRLEQIKKRNRITLIPEEGFRKKPIYLILSATAVEMASPFLNSGRRTICGSGDAGLRKAFSIFGGLNAHDYCVVLLVRPDAFDRMEGIASRLREDGFDVGRDPIGQNTELDFGVEEGK